MSALFVLPGIAFLAAVFVLPLAGLVLRSFDASGRLRPDSFEPSLANYVEIASRPLYFVILQNTFVVAAAAMVITLLLAYPVCFLLTRLPRRWGAALLLLALFPFWTSILVRLFAFTQILAPMGLLYSTTATIIGMVYYLLPYMIAILYANMIGIDSELLNAARTLGSSMMQALGRVFIPLTRSGVFAGATLTFVIGLGFFITPAILGGGSDLTIATYVQQQVIIAKWGTASAMGTVLLFLTLALYFGAGRLFQSDEAMVPGVGSQKGVSRTADIGLDLPTTIGIIAALAVFVFLLVPLVMVVLLSFTTTTYLRFPPVGFTLRWYAAFFADPAWLSSTWLSFKVALLSAVLATALGFLTAIGLERGNLPGKRIITALFLAPLIVPVILIAVTFFDLASRLHLVGKMAGFVAGHTLLALPITVLIATTALRSVGTELEQAARTLGASPARAFFAVTARLVTPSIAVAAIFAFVTSWDEPVIALFLSTSRPTLPVHIFNHIQTIITPTVAAVSTLLMLVVVLAATMFMLASRRARRRLPIDGGAGARHD